MLKKLAKELGILPAVAAARAQQPGPQLPQEGHLAAKGVI
jgi:hypothetical protein